MNKWDNDNEYYEMILEGFEESADGYVLKTEDGCLKIPKKEGVVPKIGSRIRFYSEGRFQPIRGVMIDGKMNHYKTKTEMKEDHKKWVEETREKYQDQYKKLMEKIKDDDPFDTINITGFGGGYERAVQMGLRAGIKWLAEHPDMKFDHEQYSNILGVCATNEDNTLAKELDQVLLDAMGGDMTGAQHQVLINHLYFIHTKGHDTWLEMYSDRGYHYPDELPAPTF